MSFASNITKIILYNYKRFFKTKLYCYYTRGTNYQFKVLFPIETAESLRHLSNYVCDDVLLRNAKRRFDLGQILFFCHDNNNIIGYGWKVPTTKMIYVWEVANNIHFQQPVDVLYDFYVNPNYRRKGIYKSILHYIINDNVGKSLMVIYANTLNFPSNKAIKDCGFHYIHTISFINNVIAI